MVCDDDGGWRHKTFDDSSWLMENAAKACAVPCENPTYVTFRYPERETERDRDRETESNFICKTRRMKEEEKK